MIVRMSRHALWPHSQLAAERFCTDCVVVQACRNWYGPYLFSSQQFLVVFALWQLPAVHRSLYPVYLLFSHSFLQVTADSELDHSTLAEIMRASQH